MISLKAKIEEGGFDVDLFSDSVIDAFRKSVGHVAKRGHGKWIELAQQNTKTSRTDYVNGLRQAESFVTRFTGVSQVFEIQLVGRMPNNYEFGMASYDMKAAKPGWLGGSKAKTAKDGHKYIIIPFRHSITSSARLDYSGKAKRADLKKELARVVRHYGLNRMTMAATGRPTGGPQRIPSEARTHSYLKGLTKIRKTYSKKVTQGQLFTWRIMSENSPAGSWIHPGLTAVNLMPKVEAFIDQELDTVIDKIFGATI